MNELSKTTIQRLIDGDLNDSELGLVLSLLQQHPEQWKTIGQMFVECQILDRAIRLPDDSRPEEPKQPQPATVNRSAARRWVLAAALWGVLGIGFLAGQAYAWLGKTDTPVARVDEADETTQTQAPEFLASDLGEFNETELEDVLSRSWARVPIGFRRELLREGYVLEELQSFASVNLPGGERIDVPIKRVNIEYLGQAAIQ